MKNPYTKIADLHNKGINYVVNHLLEEGGNKIEEVSEDQIAELVIKYILTLKPGLSQLEQAALEISILNSLNNTSNDGWRKMLGDSISPDAINFIDRIDEINEESNSA